MTGLARKVKVTRQTLYQWHYRGWLPFTHNLNGSPVFTEAEVQTILKFANKRKQYRAQSLGQT